MQTRSLKIIIRSLVFFQSFAHDVICLTYSEGKLSAHSGVRVLCAHLALGYRANGKSGSVQGSQSPKMAQWLISEPLLVRCLFFCNSSVTECVRLFSCANMSEIGIFCKPQWCREERSLSPLICTMYAGIESSWGLQIWLEWADWFKRDWMQEPCNPIHSVFFKKNQLAELLFGSSCSPLNLKVQNVEGNAKPLGDGFSGLGFSYALWYMGFLNNPFVVNRDQII